MSTEVAVSASPACGDVVDPLGRAGGVHLHDLLPGGPPDRVEVVDRAVVEDAPGAEDVGLRRRRGVERRGADACGGSPVARRAGRRGPRRRRGRSGVGSRSAPGRRCRRAPRRRADGVLVGLRHGLLAERRDAGPHAGADEVGMGGRRGGDDHPVHARGQHVRRLGHDRGVQLSSDAEGQLGCRVADDQLVDHRQRGQVAGVEGADAAHADESDAHVSTSSTVLGGVVTRGRRGPSGPSP